VNADGSTAVVEVINGDGAVATSWSMAGIVAPGLSAVDHLARLQLIARRLGWSVRLRNPCPRLCELLDFVGLAALIPTIDVPPESEETDR
jgi:hypothetical protein